MPCAMQERQPATQAFLTSEPMDLKALAAKNAWWSIELAPLKKLASAWGVEVGRDKLFDTCARVTMRVAHVR